MVENLALLAESESGESDRFDDWECLDHMIVQNERHLKRILKEYVAKNYHPCRTHLSLEKDCPEYRVIELPELGDVKFR